MRFSAGAAGFAALLLGLLAAIHFWPGLNHPSSSPPDQQPAPKLDDAAADGPAGDSSSRPVAAAASLSARAASFPNLRRQPELSGPNVSPQELIAQLAQVDVNRGPVTDVQAQQIRQNLQQLVARGAAAVPAIGEFLQNSQNTIFGDQGAKLAGVPSLRAGLLDALGQIGGPDALDLSRQLLKTTSDPLEVALLAQNLQQAAPGQNLDDVLNAARQTLALAADGKLPGKDLAPVFQILQSYGDAGVAADLQKAAAGWNWYAMIALADLPSGVGVPSLVKIAQDPASVDNGQYKLALQMLAQVAAQYSDAASALLGMAQQNQIPDVAWRQIAAGLSGNQYQFARLLPQNALPPETNLEVGNSDPGGGPQKFYSVPLPADGPGQNISQRLALIDQLLAAVATNPTAQAALTQARGRLTKP